MSLPTSLSTHLIVLAPFGRDALVISGMLEAARLDFALVSDGAELTRQIGAGAGAVLLTQEALTPAGLAELMAALAEQPPWSDLPVLLLLAQDDWGVRLPPEVVRLASARNVTVLQRPVPAITLLTAIQSALSARARQYEVRDLIMRERRAREQAEAATLVKDEFLATVSHELRTPLSGILLWVQLLEAGKLSAEQVAEATQAIASGARAQSQLIEDLLDVSRMLTGKLRLDLRRQALPPILNDAVDVLRPTAEAKGVRLEVQLATLPDLVQVDAERMQQIFWNLLGNAIKFTPRGGSVRLQLRREPPHVLVQVADTGEGIRPELMPYVFDRFRQADPAAARRHDGLGLGLSLVHRLVELHGGNVSAESAGEGRGSIFSVRLPLA
jgi:signal transduction histidine kinase